MIHGQARLGLAYHSLNYEQMIDFSMNDENCNENENEEYIWDVLSVCVYDSETGTFIFHR